MEAVVQSRSDDQVEVSYKILAAVMNDREKLPSTDLDSTYISKLSEWYIPALFSTGKDASGNEEYLAILMMIYRR